MDPGLDWSLETALCLTACHNTASQINISFESETRKYFLLLLFIIAVISSPVHRKPNITPQAKTTGIQYYKPRPPPPHSLWSNYHSLYGNHVAE